MAQTVAEPLADCKLSNDGNGTTHTHLEADGNISTAFLDTHAAGGNDTPGVPFAPDGDLEIHALEAMESSGNDHRRGLMKDMDIFAGGREHRAASYAALSQRT
jgi:hypothetical protein